MISSKTFLAISLFITVSISNLATADELIEARQLSVDDAYKAIPHRRTEYSSVASEQSEVVTGYLSDLFVATDMALVERINGLNGRYNSQRYQQRIDQLNAIEPPSDAKAAHQLIISAVSEHKQYFNSDRQDKHLVRSSHKKLVGAYNELMRKLPDTRRNQQAYFDHLCALDFI